MTTAAPKTSPWVLRTGLITLIALTGWQILWHAWWAPPIHALIWPTLSLSVIPLGIGLWMCLESVHRGVLFGGIVSLFYFCHGIAELWSPGAQHMLASVEIALTLILIGALGWNSRGYKRKPKESSPV